MTEYIHDEWCDLDKKGECDCVVALLEAKDKEIAQLRRVTDALIIFRTAEVNPQLPDELINRWKDVISALAELEPK